MLKNMIQKIIMNRMLVVIGLIAVVLFGIYQYRNLPTDAEHAIDKTPESL